MCATVAAVVVWLWMNVYIHIHSVKQVETAGCWVLPNGLLKRLESSCWIFWHGTVQMRPQMPVHFIFHPRWTVYRNKPAQLRRSQETSGCWCELIRWVVECFKFWGILPTWILPTWWIIYSNMIWYTIILYRYIIFNIIIWYNMIYYNMI